MHCKHDHAFHAKAAVFLTADTEIFFLKKHFIVVTLIKRSHVCLQYGFFISFPVEDFNAQRVDFQTIKINRLFDKV